MIDTHWLENPRMVPVSYNDTTAALFNLYDIKRALSGKVKNKPLDGDSEEYTIGDALDDAIEFLEQLDKAATT
jgi:hypothetical protein